MKKQIFILFILFYCITPIYSQNKQIQGKIIDRNFESIIDASIIVNDSVCVGKTGTSGDFVVNVPLSISKLSFFVPGFERADLKLADSCKLIELIMIEDANYDMSNEKADKLRRKEYKELNKLHKKAYEKGIFQSPDACYIQEFRKYSKKKK